MGANREYSGICLEFGRDGLKSLINAEDKMQDLKIVYRSPGDLIPYARNARTHSPEQIQRIAASIKEFGFTSPILLDGENGILAGHGRLAAAQLLKLDRVPTIDLTGLTKTQQRAYILADNRLALDAGWDDDLLKVEFEEIRAENFDLAITGFSEDEIEIAISGWHSDLPDFEENKEESEPKEKIIIKISHEEKNHAIEVIENALDAAGIDYEY